MVLWHGNGFGHLDPRPYITFPKGKSVTDVRWNANARVTPRQSL